MGDRGYGYARDVYGSAGYVDCERGTAAHCREFVSGVGRVDVGADVLSGVERNCVAAVGMVFEFDGAEAILHVVRGFVYG